MIRDFNQLRGGPFDVLVIGGGVYGAWTALDAALRGLKVALVDKGDFACGTSSASTKLIHGGLRYLEQLRLDLVRTSLEERRELTRIAPHRILPMRFLIPMYEDDRVGPLKLRTGLWLYDLMAGRGQPVAPHTRVSLSDAAARYGFLEQRRISGGFTYGDCQTDDFRLVLDVLDGAQQVGAAVVNYAKAISLRATAREVSGAVVQDLVTGATVEIAAAVVVNAAGPWVPWVSDTQRLSKLIRFSKGVHLVLPPLPTREALLLMSRADQRIVFVVPWYGKSLLGTTDSAFDDHPDRVAAAAADIDYLLAVANRHLQGVGWDRDAVIGAFAGLRALRADAHSALSQVSREWSLIAPKRGLLVSIGGKYTTARLDAARMVERCLERLKRPVADGSPPTTGYTLPSTPRADFAQWRRHALAQAMKTGLDKSTAEALLGRYGIWTEKIVAAVAASPELAGRVVPDLPFCWAEVLYSLRHEMVVHLEDLLRRRLPLTILHRPDPAIARRAADMAAAELGWGAADTEAEIDHLMARWILP